MHNVLMPHGNLLSVFECERILNLLYPNGVWCGLNWKVIPSFQVDCPAYFRLRDELLPNALKSAQVSAPLLGDALDGIFQWIFSHTNNHLWKYNDRLSNEDVLALLHALIDPLFNPTLYLSQHKKATGRWPANVIFDEEAAKMLDEQSGVSKSPPVGSMGGGSNSHAVFGEYAGKRHENGFGDSGGASRFFYCAKTSSRERNEGLEGMPDKEGRPLGISNWEGQTNGSGNVMGKSSPQKNNHPTVKPLRLMRYLITLIMPPKDGILLDPFAGSGSTIIAAHQLGVKAIGIEKQAEYVEIAKKRLEYYKSFQDEKEPDLFDKAMNQ